VEKAGIVHVPWEGLFRIAQLLENIKAVSMSFSGGINSKDYLRSIVVDDHGAGIKIESLHVRTF
jgi:hypothetical protein